MTDIRLAAVKSYQQDLLAEAEANRIAAKAAKARRASASDTKESFLVRIAGTLAAAIQRTTHPGTPNRVRYAD